MDFCHIAQFKTLAHLVNLYCLSATVLCRSKCAPGGGKRSCLEMLNDCSGF